MKTRALTELPITVIITIIVLAAVISAARAEVQIIIASHTCAVGDMAANN